MLSLSSVRTVSVTLLLLCAICSPLEFVKAQGAGGSPGQVFHSDAFLATLTFDTGDLLPSPFDPNTTSYSLSVTPTTDQVVFSFTLHDPDFASAFISIDGSDKTYQPANSQFAVPLFTSGVTQLVITTFAGDSTTTIDYQVLIYKPESIASSNANIVSVVFSQGSFQPTFSSRTFTYGLTLPNQTPTQFLPVGISVSSADIYAFIQVQVGTRNAITVTSGLQTFIRVYGSDTVITVRGISQDLKTTLTYTFNIIRQGGFETGGGGITGDPIFTGLRGQVYQVHGVDGEVYNILSSWHTQMNAEFVFLEEGECPVVNGRKLKDCWTHNGSYLGRIGLQLRVPFMLGATLDPSRSDFMPPKGELDEVLFHRLTPDNIKSLQGIVNDPQQMEMARGLTYWTALQYILIESGDAKTGFDSVLVNNQRIQPGELITFPFPYDAALESMHELMTSTSVEVDTPSPVGTEARKRRMRKLKAGDKSAFLQHTIQHQYGFIHYVSNWRIIVSTPYFRIVIENSDHFLNQHLHFHNQELAQLFQKGEIPLHGLFGQTILGKEYPMQKIKAIEGDVDDYVVSFDETALPPANAKYNNTDRIWGGQFLYNFFQTDEQLDAQEFSILSQMQTQANAAAAASVASSSLNQRITTKFPSSVPAQQQQQPSDSWADPTAPNEELSASVTSNDEVPAASVDEVDVSETSELTNSPSPRPIPHTTTTVARGISEAALKRSEAEQRTHHGHH